MKKISKKSKQVLKGLLDYLKDTGEEKLLPEVTQTLGEVVVKSKKAEEIVVTSVVPLTDEEKENLQDILSKNLQGNLPIVNKIDKTLLAGFTIRVKDWFFDASLARQLESLKRSIMS